MNKLTVPIAVLGGVLLIGALIFTMNYNPPLLGSHAFVFRVDPVMSVATNQVMDVPVQGNQSLEQGDVLFRIDPLSFENKAKSIKTQLISARADLNRISELIKA